MPALKSIEELNLFFMSLRHGLFKSGTKEAEDALQAIVVKLRTDYNTDPVLFAECIAEHPDWSIIDEGTVINITAPIGHLRMAAYPDPVFLPAPLQPWYHRALGLFR